MAYDNSHYAMDGKIQAGDVIVSHVNGTLDLYIIATVLSAVADLTLHSVSTMKGQEAALMHGYEQQKDDHAVWLFAGSAAAYVKAPPAEWLLSRVGAKAVTPDSVMQLTDLASDTDERRREQRSRCVSNFS